MKHTQISTNTDIDSTIPGLTRSVRRKDSRSGPLSGDKNTSLLSSTVRVYRGSPWKGLEEVPEV